MAQIELCLDFMISDYEGIIVIYPIQLQDISLSEVILILNIPLVLIVLEM